MSPADSYRKIAAELRAMAAKETSAPLASEWNHLAQCYVRLAEQADANNIQDLWLEFGNGPRLDRGGA